MVLDARFEASVIDFDVDDPFANSNLAHTDALVDHYSRMGFYGDTRIDLTRVRRGRIDYDNPATAALCRDFPASRDWLDLMPTAAALDALYDPHLTHFPNGVRVDESIRDYFCNLADARGIRSRAAVFRQIAVEDAMNRPQQSRWLSLACGAAHPALHAVSQVHALGGREPQMTMVDIDPEALQLARRYAHQHGVRGEVDYRRMNLLDLRGFRPVGLLGNRRALQPGSFDLVEAIGLLEYLRRDDWTYRYNRVVEKRRVMAGACTFLRHAWQMVAPGGHLVVGNMLTTHPQLGFTLNVVQWPHVQPRDVATMLRLLDDAGVVGRRQIFLPTDGVYAMYVVQKP